MTAVPTEQSKSAVLRFVIARLKEGSTLRGAIMILSATGIVLRPELSDAIVSVGMALAGLFGVLLPDTAAQ